MNVTRFSHVAILALTGVWAVPAAASATVRVPAAVAQGFVAAAAKADSALHASMRYAVAVPAGVALDRDAWVGAGALSRNVLQVEAGDAVTTSLELSNVYLPEGVRFWFEGGGVSHGPYSAENLTDHRFWTPVVPGGVAAIRVEAPAGATSQVRMSVANVHYGYRSMDAVPVKSGSCQIDVACSAGAAYTNQARSVARMTLGGTTLCTGQLVNNGLGNHDPLFLTAWHCGIDRDAPASSIVTYWNFQRASCASGSGSLSQTITGGTLLSTYVGSDFALVRLSQTPPASFNVFYAGWDATGIAPASGATIHHPSGSEKAISLFSTTPPKVTQNVGGNNVDAWEIQWSQGATEGGSSGSELLDASGRIIGQLSGGYSSCAATTAKDYFGRFEISYDGGRTSDQQLASYLDPSVTCSQVMDGLDGSASRVQPSLCPSDATQAGIALQSLSVTGGSQIGTTATATVVVATAGSGNPVQGIGFSFAAPAGTSIAGVVDPVDSGCTVGTKSFTSSSATFSGYQLTVGSHCTFGITLALNAAKTSTTAQLGIGDVHSQGGGNSYSKSASFAIAPTSAPSAGNVTFTTSRSKIFAGESVTLSWNAPQGETCIAGYNWSGNKAISGSEVVTPSFTGNNQYDLYCENSLGNYTASVFVEVSTQAVGAAPSSGGGGPVPLSVTVFFVLAALVRRMKPVAAALCFAIAGCGQVASANVGTVEGDARVVDGGTIEIDGGRYALHGIDAPEISQRCQDSATHRWEACGRESADYLREIIANRSVRCSIKGRSPRAAVSADCYVAGESLSRIQVKSGHALAVDAPGASYFASETTARSQRRGLWRTKFLEPKLWRRGQRMPGETEAQ